MALEDNVGIVSKVGIFKMADTVGGELRNWRCKAQEIGQEATRSSTDEETYCGIATSVGSTKIVYTGKFLWDGTEESVDEFLYNMRDLTAPAAYEWYPGGDTAGQPKYSGSGYLISAKKAARTPGSILVDIIYNSASESREII